MYDEHLYCPEYRSLKDTIVNIINGDDTETDIDELADKIQKLYDKGQMQSTQYDDLMRYMQDLL